jgi:CHAT domain-containing protein
VPPTDQDFDRAARSARKLGLLRDGDNWERLPLSRQEAEQIVALAPKSESKLALDFDASLTTATASEIGEYRILHFATHAVFNDETPELSGLVLSLVNEKGEFRNGFLSLPQVFNLNLKAELVVLSACKTGLGKDIRGEGLVGLTRGFMYAGAPRIVASLWVVRDEDALELMARFYSAVLREKLRPAAALRKVQLSMWRERRWSTKRWAGFVFQGEWR